MLLESLESTRTKSASNRLSAMGNECTLDLQAAHQHQGTICIVHPWSLVKGSITHVIYEAGKPAD